MSNIRFVDSLKVGAYSTEAAGSGGITINNNVNNFLLTATGNPEIINGEPNLVFDGNNLGISTTNPIVRFEISSSNATDLMLVRNTSNHGIKVTSDGVLQLLEFNSLPGTPPDGGIAFVSGEFYFSN